MTQKIAVIVGSNAKDSINRKLAKALIKLGAGKAEFTLLDIAHLPMYNRDLDNTPPEEVVQFKKEASAHDGYLFLTPEYNRSIPAVLKNAIDWGSRPQATSIWRKPVAVTGTSPGGIGTGMAQQHLKNILTDIAGPLLPGGVYLTYKSDMIDESDTVVNDDTKKFLQGFIDKTISFFEKQAS